MNLKRGEKNDIKSNARSKLIVTLTRSQWKHYKNTLCKGMSAYSSISHVSSMIPSVIYKKKTHFHSYHTGVSTMPLNSTVKRTK